MAFILPDYDNLDRVTFHIKKHFSDNPCIISHYIDRRDNFALRYYIKRYMDTDIAIPRPDTPAKLIVPAVPKWYSPPL